MKRPGVQGFSTLTEMYSAWREFDIPATFYHYFLTLLKNKSKSDQAFLMNKQISSLRSGTHLYVKIKSSIEARQHSLHIIKSTLPLLKDHETLSKPLLSSSEEREFLGYKKLFESKQNPEERGENRQLRQLANHLVIYRKITLQIIFLIHKWMAELMSLGYEGMIQFLYKNEDYLEEITEKTSYILNEYQEFFQFNPFFILRKKVPTTHQVLINDYLKISPEYAKNLYEGLKLLADYHSNFLMSKMVGQSSPRKLLKSSSVDKIYGNLLSGKNYHTVNDSYLKSEQILSKQNSTIQTSNIQRNKSEVKILPSIQDPTSMRNIANHPKTNFIERKYPTFFSDNTENQLAKGKKSDLADFLLKRRYSSTNDTIKPKKSLLLNDPLNADDILKRNPRGIGLRSQMINLIQNLRNNIEQRQSQTFQRQEIVEFSNNVIELNQGIQKSSITEETKLEFKVQKNIYPTNILRYLSQLFKRQLQSEDTSRRMSSQKIQKLAKALLSQRQHISIYKIFKKEQSLKPKNEKKSSQDTSSLVAWMVCKLYKDNSTLEKAVDIVFLYQFQKSSNLKNSIIEHFQEFGYLNLKQNGTLVHQTNPPDYIQFESSQVIRCKYKVSPYASDQDIKDIIKSNIPLKMSRILKYHYYSKTSKYHKFCDHRSKEGTCSINYFFQHTSKVFINSKPHIKVKIDSISIIKDCYKVYHHLNNKTFLIVATTIQDLKQMDKHLEKEHEEELDQDQSFDKEKLPKTCEFNWICFEEGKVMRKFVNERNKTVINEFIWIGSNIPEVKSIALDKKDIIGTDILVLSQPYVLGIYGKDDQQSLKSLAVLDFSQ